VPPADSSRCVRQPLLRVVFVFLVPPGDLPRGLEAEVCGKHRAIPLRTASYPGLTGVVRTVIRDTLFGLSLSGMTT
jgi:hypothetical protein